MTFFQAIFLGFVQGVAEFLPISSSGHLAIFQNLFHMNGVGEVDLFFDVLLHFGTLFSVFVAYWTDIKGMILEFLSMLRLYRHPNGVSGDKNARRLIWFVVVGTLPMFLILPIKDSVEGLYNNMFFIGAALIVTGLLLFFSDRYQSGRKQTNNATLMDAFLVGCGQMIAVVPGLSRSGATISSGLLRGFERSFAVKFSFLLSIPAILGASLLEVVDAVSAGIDTSMLPYYLSGMVTAAVCGYCCIRLLQKISRSKNFGVFSYYCWGAGLLTLFLAAIG